MIYSKQIERNASGFAEATLPVTVLEFLDAPGSIKGRNISSGWVPVQERLPASSGNYLVVLRSAGYRVMNYSREGETFLPRSINRAVTHWMPLPPGPA
jgi:hypothetical protein